LGITKLLKQGLLSFVVDCDKPLIDDWSEEDYLSESDRPDFDDVLDAKVDFKSGGKRVFDLFKSGQSYDEV
jgi:hypothetical protein